VNGLISEAKTQFELEWWHTAEAKRGAATRQRRIALLKLFKISGNMGAVLEAGTGPTGGILPALAAHRKVGLDPLYWEYAESALLQYYPDIEYVVGCIETASPTDFPVLFDNIISANALDHGESDFKSLSNIAALLKPGGRLFLHVHLRRLGQLNAGHDHVLRLEDYEVEAASSGLREEWRELYETDPISRDAYRTLVACLRKPE